MKFSTTMLEKEHFVAVFLCLFVSFTMKSASSTHFAAKDSMTFCYPSLTLPIFFSLRQSLTDAG